jgi:hypothetical protein
MHGQVLISTALYPFVPCEICLTHHYNRCPSFRNLLSRAQSEIFLLQLQQPSRYHGTGRWRLVGISDEHWIYVWEVSSTSMASPHVAGAIAKLWSVCHDKSLHTQVEACILSSAMDLGAAGKDVYYAKAWFRLKRPTTVC